MQPIVSVIVPNYNHAKFLKKRLDSIFNQTFKDFEVIFLDDASTDESLQIVRSYKDERLQKVICNDVNTGSPFKQWNKGIHEARGRYIWIAESDDCADPCLLSKLVAILDGNSNVGIAYCNSWLINEDDFVVGAMNRHYVVFPYVDRWLVDFVNNGRNECAKYLSVMNTIPNASAVVFKREIYEKIGGAESDYKLCGDWALWVRMLLVSDVAYVAHRMNYFRKHALSVRSKTDKNGLYVLETYDIVKRISEQVKIDPLSIKLTGRLLAGIWISRAMLYDSVFAKTNLIYPIAKEVDPNLRKNLIFQIIRHCGAALLGLRKLHLSRVLQLISKVALLMLVTGY